MNISRITRLGIVDVLLQRDGSFSGKMNQIDFLNRVWNLQAMPSTDGRFSNAESDIWQHTINNDDWTESYLLHTRLGLANSADSVFLTFVETSVHPLVGTAGEIAERVRAINPYLKPDGYKLVPTSLLSGRQIYSAQKVGGLAGGGTPVYEIVLSFAGEDRDYVNEVAMFLNDNDVELFYDGYEEATLWGKDLIEHLDTVFRRNARYCVMFISTHYRDKVWPNHERRSALARALLERQEYILPARFDDTELPGLRPTLGYVDLRNKTPEELGRLILQKLGRHIAH